jgi:sporulation protein YlmC with PRC-barrel domain
MSKLSMTATFAAILATAMPVAYAQTRATPDTRAAVTGGEPGRIIQPNQIRASKMIGRSIYDVQNRNIGSVKDLVLDSDGRVAAVVAISMSDVKTDNNRLTLDRSKEQLQQMAEYQLEDRTTGAGTSASPTTGGRLGR